jgi:5'-nucleotidase
MKKTILLTNDDGLFSPGLTALADRLRAQYQVFVVAPDRERSAVSMALTLHQPLRAKKHDDATWSVDGTPSDCVNLAIRQLLPAPPDWVISGMNLGENLSEDIFYSGTVAASFTAYLYGIRTLAVSLVSEGQSYEHPRFDIPAGVRVTESVFARLVDGGRGGIIYNLNIPFQPIEGIWVTRIGHKRYIPDVEKRTDPRGREYYWMGTGNPQYRDEPGTDVAAVRRGASSLTPFAFTLNSEAELAPLKELFP